MNHGVVLVLLHCGYLYITCVMCYICSCVCCRLYSSAVYENYFEKYTPAEIMQRPVEDLVLQMKVCCLILTSSAFFIIYDDIAAFTYFL